MIIAKSNGVATFSKDEMGTFESSFVNGRETRREARRLRVGVFVPDALSLGVAEGVGWVMLNETPFSGFPSVFGSVSARSGLNDGSVSWPVAGSCLWLDSIAAGESVVGIVGEEAGVVMPRQEDMARVYTLAWTALQNR